MEDIHMKKICLFSIILLLSSCAGSKGNVRFDSLKYPVSMSPVLFDESGKPAYFERQLTSLGQYEEERVIWGMFWTALSFNGEQDFSDSMNEKVTQLQGDAIVNVRIRTNGCSLNYIPLVNILPIWPGCTVIKIKGDVVKYAKAK